MKKPADQVTDIDEAEYQTLIERVRIGTLDEQDRNWLVVILETFRFIQGALEQKKVAIHILKEILYGKKTEKDKLDKKNRDKDKPKKTESPSSDQSCNKKSEESPPAVGAASENTTQTKEDQVLDELDPPQTGEHKPSPGHGRRPSDSWSNAELVKHCHTCLKSGQICPNCEKGTLYPYKKPAVFARIVGGAPMGIEIHRCDRLRCSLCGDLFTAPLPKDVQDFPISTPEANAVAAVTKYQAATPFNRFANVLKAYGVPIPRTRLYDMGSMVAEDALPLFGALCRFAAQGELFQNDDTKVLVQSLLQENKKAEEAGIELDRKGMFTTGIIAQVGEHRIALYFTGRNHAGENLAKILQERIKGLPLPTQVADRLAANKPKGHEVDDSGCHDHFRREFYEIRAFFPKSCAYVLKELKIIYRADAIAKKKKMTPTERLKLHQEVSLPVMERLKIWGHKELDEKRVEPNGPLGHAIKYLIKHYPALTLFTRKEGVPIANSACEQSLKTPIAVRKMAYFFKTIEGAAVASIIFSLIQTCIYENENAFDYFVAIQRNSKDVRENPEKWFPWNFRERLECIRPKEAKAA